MDKSGIPHELKAPVDPTSAAEDPEWEKLVQTAAEEINHARELQEQLIAGARNELFGEASKPAISLKRSAEFLAWLSRTENAKLPWVVRVGLESLGLSRLSKKRGRPRGRIADLRYVKFVEQRVREIEQHRVFERMRQAKRKNPMNWDARFTSQLASEGWPSEKIHVLLFSRTPSSFAKHLASAEFDVSYDAVDRACRRIAEPAKN